MPAFSNLQRKAGEIFVKQKLGGTMGGKHGQRFLQKI